ncbi:hypothetical protein FSP39_019047 [Pinctada imbricata]|uniref:Uncharacterized protein n=1 Tax=Pinctada imbricata TaxID=66713 RepID=A0AA88XE64_PINIB|nr:hypothetical protein FSP39_019047 [Pinctada imbricata]
MPPMRRSRVRPTVNHDPELPVNWSIVRLRGELQKHGVVPPSNTRRMTLVRLLEETRAVSNLQETVTSLSTKVHTLENRNSGGPSQPQICHSAPTAPSVESRSFTGSGSGSFTIASAFSAFRNQIPAAAGSEHQTAQPPSNSNVGQYARGPFGYSMESLPAVETVSPQLRQQIIQGRDVNLASLLIPYYAGPFVDTLDPNPSTQTCQNFKSDPRLNKMLSIGEFIQAFGTYKAVMCSVYPSRRAELDSYERDIVEMATRYPGKGFYEYHKQFSLTAAAHLRYNNILVDWSIRNNSLFCNIFANTRAASCSLCNSTLHTTGFCPLTKDNDKFAKKNQDSERDTYGRKRVFYAGKEICNNYNGDKGCKLWRCNNSHVCLDCKGEHPKYTCPNSKNGSMTQSSGTNALRK